MEDLLLNSIIDKDKVSLKYFLKCQEFVKNALGCAIQVQFFYRSLPELSFRQADIYARVRFETKISSF